MTRMINGGNRVEEFGMFFQLSSLLLVFRYIKNVNLKNSSLLMLGFFAGMMFLLKPNLIGILISFIIYLVFSKNDLSKKILQIIYLLLGFSVLQFLVIYYLNINRALPSFFDQVFVFNSAYSNVSTESVWSILKFYFNFLKPFSYLLPIIPVVLYKYKNISAYLKFLTLWLTVEILLSLISKRNYNQYFLPTIVPLSLLVSMTVKYAIDEYKHKFSKKTIILFLSSVFAICIFGELINIVKSFDEHKPFTKNLSFRSYIYNNFGEHKETLEIIDKFTNPSDKILIWGSEPSLLFLSNRTSIDKYYYQFRLFLPRYDSKELKLTELVNDIIQEKPKLIVDASSSTADSLISDFQQSPPLTGIAYDKWLKQSGFNDSLKIRELIKFLETDYAKNIESYGGKWNIYIRK